MSRRITFTNERGLVIKDPKTQVEKPSTSGQEKQYPKLESTRQKNMRIRDDYHDLIAMKRAGGCILCKSTDSPSLYHRFPEDKAFEVITLPVNVSKEEFITELDKYVVLCGSCYTAVQNSPETAERLKSYDASYEAIDFGNSPDHLAYLINLWGLKPVRR